MAKKVRNWEPLPLLDSEGYFTKDIPLALHPATAVPVEEVGGRLRAKPHWTEGLTPWERLFSHHTIASVRQNKTFVRPYVLRDDLDFVLSSTYNHNLENFPERVDVILQPETQGIDTWRLLRNQRIIPPPKIIPRGHPCVQGGITEMKSVHHVKLGIGSYHSAQTNAGYSRKEDGTFYAV